MKKLISTMFVVMIVFLSCKTTKHPFIGKTSIKSDYFPFDKQWSDSLVSSSADVKKALLNLYSNDMNKFNKDFSFNLTEEEYNNLKTLSTETFSIDSVDFENINERSSIRPILKLVNTEAECYLIKDSDIILFMDQHLKNGQWKVSSTGRIFDEVGNQIENLYFKKNIKVHDVIINGDKKNSYKKRFVVFVRDGQYYSIEYGTEVPFLQDLLKYKARLEQKEIE